MTTELKQKTGSVGIEVKGYKLRLRLPRHAIDTNIPRYISTGLYDTSENRQTAQIVAWEIEGDIKANRLTETIQGHIDRFKPKLPLKPNPQSLKQNPLTLSELWVKYCDYKKPQLAPTTYQSDYCKKWANHITKLPQGLDAVEVRDRIVSTLSIDTSKRLLTLLSACCHWAVKSNLIHSNPFDGMSADLKLPKADTEIDPFSLSERDRILEAFQTLKPHYYPFVRFLFLTGCRTGEAIALTWGKVAHDNSSIAFTESYSSKLKLTKGTKTGKRRKFPCNPVLRSLLGSIRPTDPQPTDLVFTSPKGVSIDNCRFTSRVWKGGTYAGNSYRGIVTDLVAKGVVERYRSPYNTHHTFITLMLEAGLTIPQVAKLVGNSPEIVLKHYAGSAIDEVPIV